MQSFTTINSTCPFFEQNKKVSNRKTGSTLFVDTFEHQKKLCTKLMKYSTIVVPKEIDGTYKNFNCIKFECLRQYCSKKATGILIDYKKGHANIFKHLVQCYGGEKTLFFFFSEVEELSERNSEPTGKILTLPVSRMSKWIC